MGLSTINITDLCSNLLETAQGGGLRRRDGKNTLPAASSRLRSPSLLTYLREAHMASHPRQIITYLWLVRCNALPKDNVYLLMHLQVSSHTILMSHHFITKLLAVGPWL